MVAPGHQLGHGCRAGLAVAEVRGGQCVQEAREEAAVTGSGCAGEVLQYGWLRGDADGERGLVDARLFARDAVGL